MIIQNYRKCMKYIYWEVSRELHAVQITYRACFENGSYTVLHKESQKKNVTYGDGLLISTKGFISLLTAATWPAFSMALLTLWIQIWLYTTMGKGMKYKYWEASRELHAVQITYRACFENGSYTVLHQQSQQKNVTPGDGLLIAIKRFISPHYVFM